MGGRAVNDEFLTKLRPRVPPDLEARIRQRIRALQREDDDPHKGQWAARRAMDWARCHKAIAIGLTLTLLAACAAGLVRIGGFAIAEGTEPPVEPPEGVEPATQEMVDRMEALAAVSFEVGLPEWVPEGYGMTERAMVTLPSEGSPLSDAWQVWLYWESREGSSVLLVAFPSVRYRGDALRFGPGSGQEVDLGGVRGAAIRGNWGVDGKVWHESAGGNVLWVRGDTAYWLQSSSVDLEELVRMARSVP